MNEVKKTIDDRIKCRRMFKKFTKEISENLNIHPILIGQLALTDYFFRYDLNKKKIEFLIEEEYCYGKKKEEFFSFLINNNYESLDNNKFQKDGILFFYDSVERYNIDKNKCKRNISSFCFKRVKDKIKWETKPSLEYYLLPFSIFKEIYQLRKDEKMLQIIYKVEEDLEKEKIEEAKRNEDSEIRQKIHNCIINGPKNHPEVIKDLSIQYKRSRQEIETMFVQYSYFLERDMKNEKHKNSDILEIVHGTAQAGALKSSCFKENKTICLGYLFNMGKLDDTRKIWLKEILDDKYLKFVKETQKNLNNALKKFKKVRIWSSRKNDNEYLMLLYLCSILPDNKDIYVTFADLENFRSISYLEDKRIEKVSKNEHKLTKEEKNEYAQEWQRIINENGEVRFFENGKLKSVSFDYFDESLLEVLKVVGEVSCVRFIGDLLGNDFLNDAGDIEYKYLIDRLIKKGKIDVISDGLEFKNTCTESEMQKIIKVKE